MGGKPPILKMLFFLNLISVLLIFLFVIKFDRKMIFFWSAICFLYYFPISIDYYYSHENNVTIHNVLLFSLMFNIIYLLFGFAFKRQGNDSFNAVSLGWVTKFDLYFLCFIFFVSVTIPIFLVYIKYGSFLNIGWRDTKSIPYYLIFLYLYYFSSISLYISLSVFKEKLVSISIIILALFFVLTFQSRSLILPIIFPIIYHYLYFHNGLGRLKVILLGGVFLLSFFLLQQFRYSGLDNFSIELALSNIAEQIVRGEGELSIIDVFYYLMERGEYVVGFSEGWSYLRVFFFYLPAGLFDIKPLDFSYEIWNAYTGIYNVGGSLHPTHYGMAFGNFSWLGVLFGPIFLILFSVAYDFIIKSLNINGLMVISSFLSGTVLMARGSIYNGFLVVIIGLFLGVLFNYIRKLKV